MDQEILNKIRDLLNEDSFNYTVFLKYHNISVENTLPSDVVIRMILGEGAKLQKIEDVQGALIWAEVEESLLYAGAYAGGPSETAFENVQFIESMNRLKDQIENLSKISKKIESFRLRHGHPAYPVYWDFAFLFRQEASAALLIGSSSD